MVDTDDTRRTTDDGRRTTPRVWHKLPTGELKNVEIIKRQFITNILLYQLHMISKRVIQVTQIYFNFLPTLGLLIAVGFSHGNNRQPNGCIFGKIMPSLGMYLNYGFWIWI